MCALHVEHVPQKIVSASPSSPFKMELELIGEKFIPNSSTGEGRERERKKMRKHLSAIANDLLQRCAQYVTNFLISINVFFSC